MRFSTAFDPFRALGSAWSVLMRAPAAMWVCGLLITLVEGGGQAGLRFGMSDFEPELAVLLAPLVIFGCLAALALLLVSSWLSVGYVRGVEGVLRAGACELGDTFRDNDGWLDLFFTRVLVVLMSGLALLPWAACFGFGMLLAEGLDLPEGVALGAALLAALVYLPVFAWLALGWYLAPFACVVERLEPVPAIRRAFALADGRRWQLLWFALVLAGVGIAGLLLCCVGVVPAGIWTRVAQIEAYVAFVRERQPGEWWIDARQAPRPGEGDGPSPPPPRDVEPEQDAPL